MTMSSRTGTKRRPTLYINPLTVVEMKAGRSISCFIYIQNDGSGLKERFLRLTASPSPREPDISTQQLLFDGSDG